MGHVYRAEDTILKRVVAIKRRRRGSNLMSVTTNDF